MLSLRIGIPLAEIRKMPAEDYYKYLVVLDAEHKINTSLIKRKD